jgi:hypothetical protein
LSKGELPTADISFQHWHLGFKFAGGSPAAGYFLLFGQKKVTKENAALLNRPLRSSLRCSRGRAAAQLA